MAPKESEAIECEVTDVLLQEWLQQRDGHALRSIAIVDEAPAQQYLYPEFVLYCHLLKRRGLEVAICDPRELTRRDGRLWRGSLPIDLVYNRLTDFPLEDPAHEVLKRAYLGGEAVVTPHPRAHALYADKRNLTLLSDEEFLRSASVAAEAVNALVAAVPPTQFLTDANRDAMWERRRTLFFKPAAGYGSKAAYRGDKLTRRVWDQMRDGVYVAQALVVPSERHLGRESPVALKADIRNYAYAGGVQLVAARLYQGQTTNLRTQGGGFASVFTEST